MVKKLYRIIATKQQLEAIGIDYNISGYLGEFVKEYSDEWACLKVIHDLGEFQFKNRFDIPMEFIEYVGTSEDFKDLRVTFDFDNTLSRTDVQMYARELVQRGMCVWVLTMRYDEIHKHKWAADPCNEDLYKVLDKVGIPRWKVRFCNMEEWGGMCNAKAKYLQGTNVIFHLDDSPEELCSFKLFKGNKTLPIQVRQPHWKHKCERAIENYLEYGRPQKS